MIGGLLTAAAAWAFGCAIAPRTELPAVVRFTTGAVALSFSVFVALTFHLGYPAVWMVLLAAAGVAAWRLRARSVPRLPRPHWLALAGFVLVALIYLVIAISPEVQADALAYHLRIARDYNALHTFSNRLQFFELMPHGVEALYVPAVAFGGFIPAKVLHLIFLMAAAGLVRHIARALDLPDYTGVAAALMFFLSPVAAIDGTSAYVDMGLVCGCASTFYLLLRWNKERTTSLLVLAALNAGFCYTVKQTFGVIAVAVVVFVAVQSRVMKQACLFAAAAFAPIAPWMIRAAVVSGNPFAPFLNAIFPNQVSRPDIEAGLAGIYSVANPQFSWLRALPEYTIRGGHQGVFGGAYLLLPLALIGLRTAAGRWLLGAACIAALPALANTGTRFLMPSMLLAGLAVAMSVPPRVAARLALLQFAFAIPPVLDFFQHTPDWRMREIPWRAAFGLQEESAYLASQVSNFRAGRMVQANTPRNAHVLALTDVPNAYVPQDVTPFWQSASAMRSREALEFAMAASKDPAAHLAVQWSPGTRRALRVTSSWDLRILDANLGHVPLASRSLKAHRAGIPLEYPLPEGAYSADLLIWPQDAPLHVDLKSGDGRWRRTRLAKTPSATDVRLDATAYVRRSGYTHILISEEGPFAPLAKSFIAEPGKWGLRHVTMTETDHLFEVLDQLRP